MYITTGSDQSLTEGPGICGGLRTPSGGVGTCNKGCVTDQAYPSEGHALYFKIPDRLDKWSRGAQNELSEEWWEHGCTAMELRDLLLLHRTSGNRDIAPYPCTISQELV